MRTDYKFWFVRRGQGSIVGGVEQPDGPITEVAVRLYEGDVTTEFEDGREVTRYRRVARLTPASLPHLQQRATRSEASGATTAIYTARDFGRTSDLDVVRSFLKAELAKDSTRSPIDEQVVTLEDQARIDAIRPATEEVA
jgi:hypothetical protein